MIQSPFADLLRQRVHPDEGIRAGVQEPIAEGGILLVQVFAHHTGLGLRQLGGTEGLGESDSAGEDAEEAGGDEDRDKSLFHPPTFEKPVQEVTALPQLGDGKFDGRRRCPTRADDSQRDG